MSEEKKSSSQEGIRTRLVRWWNHGNVDPEQPKKKKEPMFESYIDKYEREQKEKWEKETENVRHLPVEWRETLREPYEVQGCPTGFLYIREEQFQGEELYRPYLGFYSMPHYGYRMRTECVRCGWCGPSQLDYKTVVFHEKHCPEGYDPWKSELVQ